MRGSAAVQVTVVSFTVWRLGLVLAWVVVTAVWAVWLAQISTSGGAPLAAVMTLAAVAIAWIGWPLLRVGPVAIRWDGSDWRVGRGDADPESAPRGALHVHLDFGTWLLLRFVPEDTAARVAASWLPVQRQGSAHQWHALRCALYAPQPKSTALLAEQSRGGYDLP